MDRTPAWAVPDRHIHYANLVFHLPDHDAGLAGMSRHPIKNSG